jgi:hypothetical protein
MNTMAMAYAQRRYDKARERLFAAGWKPMMAYSPVQSPEHHELLLALNAAGTAVTRQAMKR